MEAFSTQVGYASTPPEQVLTDTSRSSDTSCSSRLLSQVYLPVLRGAGSPVRSPNLGRCKSPLFGPVLFLRRSPPKNSWTLAYPRNSFRVRSPSWHPRSSKNERFCSPAKTPRDRNGRRCFLCHLGVEHVCCTCIRKSIGSLPTVKCYLGLIWGNWNWAPQVRGSLQVSSFYHHCSSSYHLRGAHLLLFSFLFSQGQCASQCPSSGR